MWVDTVSSEAAKRSSAELSRLRKHISGHPLPDWTEAELEACIERGSIQRWPLDRVRSEFSVVPASGSWSVRHACVVLHDTFNDVCYMLDGKDRIDTSSEIPVRLIRWDVKNGEGTVTATTYASPYYNVPCMADRFDRMVQQACSAAKKRIRVPVRNNLVPRSALVQIMASRPMHATIPGTTVWRVLGIPGTGKTTLGNEIIKEAKVAAIDIDDLVKEAYLSIRDNPDFANALRMVPHPLAIPTFEGMCRDLFIMKAKGKGLVVVVGMFINSIDEYVDRTFLLAADELVSYRRLLEREADLLSKHGSAIKALVSSVPQQLIIHDISNKFGIRTGLNLSWPEYCAWNSFMRLSFPNAEYLPAQEILALVKVQSSSKPPTS
jgi:hypothetical protein